MNKTENYRQQIITLLAISPRTIAELCNRTGGSDTRVRLILKSLKESGLCHIVAYKNNGRSGISKFSALFTHGPGEDATPPKSFAEQVERRRQHDERKREKLNSSANSHPISTKVSCYGIWGLA